MTSSHRSRYASAARKAATRWASFASRNAFLYLLDCLYGTMFSLNYEQNKQNLSAFSQRKVERSYYYIYLPDTETNY